MGADGILTTIARAMIHLHRLRGEDLYLNADLIESIENTPDTVLTMVDGRKLTVQESPAEVVELVAHFRASVLRAVERIERQPAGVVRLVRPDD